MISPLKIIYRTFSNTRFINATKEYHSYDNINDVITFLKDRDDFIPTLD